MARLFEADGYGFIETEEGLELYFSKENVTESGFGNLQLGMAVQFLEESGAEGLQAKRVSAGKHQAP